MFQDGCINRPEMSIQKCMLRTGPKSPEQEEDIKKWKIHLRSIVEALAASFLP